MAQELADLFEELIRQRLIGPEVIFGTITQASPLFVRMDSADSITIGPLDAIRKSPKLNDRVGLLKIPGTKRWIVIGTEDVICPGLATETISFAKWTKNAEVIGNGTTQVTSRRIDYSRTLPTRCARIEFINHSPKYTDVDPQNDDIEFDQWHKIKDPTQPPYTYPFGPSHHEYVFWSPAAVFVPANFDMFNEPTTPPDPFGRIGSAEFVTGGGLITLEASNPTGFWRFWTGWDSTLVGGDLVVFDCTIMTFQRDPNIIFTFEVPAGQIQLYADMHTISGGTSGAAQADIRDPLGVSQGGVSTDSEFPFLFDNPMAGIWTVEAFSSFHRDMGGSYTFRFGCVQFIEAPTQPMTMPFPSVDQVFPLVIPEGTTRLHIATGGQSPSGDQADLYLYAPGAWTGNFATSVPSASETTGGFSEDMIFFPPVSGEWTAVMHPTTSTQPTNYNFDWDYYAPTV